MKFWRRRKPLSIPAELIKPNEPWPAPSEVIHGLDDHEPHVHDPQTCPLRKCGQRVALKDKITMTGIRG